MTRFVVESGLNVESSGVSVPTSTDPGQPVDTDSLLKKPVFLSVDTDSLELEVEWQSVASSAPEPVYICLGTTANVVVGDRTAAAGAKDAVVQTECLLCALNGLIDQVKPYLLSKIIIVSILASSPNRKKNGFFFHFVLYESPSCAGVPLRDLVESTIAFLPPKLNLKG